MKWLEPVDTSSLLLLLLFRPLKVDEIRPQTASMLCERRRLLRLFFQAAKLSGGSPRIYGGDGAL